MLKWPQKAQAERAREIIIWLLFYLFELYDF